MFRVCILTLAFFLIPLSSSGDVLERNEMEKLLHNSPNIIGAKTINRSLQIWILTSDKRGVIWCESFVNEDKAMTETICFDNKDPDK
tara:strand:- start:120 stop:380 length:261 start_codon:yes stop_codon:yes gene_type:complete